MLTLNALTDYIQEDYSPKLEGNVVLISNKVN